MKEARKEYEEQLEKYRSENEKRKSSWRSIRMKQSSRRNSWRSIRMKRAAEGTAGEVSE